MVAPAVEFTTLAFGRPAMAVLCGVGGKLA
jgi:hypothetical protein